MRLSNFSSLRSLLISLSGSSFIHVERRVRREDLRLSLPPRRLLREEEDRRPSDHDNASRLVAMATSSSDLSSVGTTGMGSIHPGIPQSFSITQYWCRHIRARLILREHHSRCELIRLCGPFCWFCYLKTCSGFSKASRGVFVFDLQEKTRLVTLWRNLQWFLVCHQ